MVYLYNTTRNEIVFFSKTQAKEDLEDKIQFSLLNGFYLSFNFLFVLS